MATIFNQQIAKHRAIEVRRIHFLERRAVAFLPMPDEIAVQHAGPRDPALQESDLEVGEAPGHAAEKQRLADRLQRGGEMTDVVVGEVAERAANRVKQDRKSNVRKWIIAPPKSKE